MRAGSRLARAVRTKSASSTVTISTRMIRARIAAGPIGEREDRQDVGVGAVVAGDRQPAEADAEDVDEPDAEQEVGDDAEHDAAWW